MHTGPLHVDRTLAAIAQRPSADTAQRLLDFFLTCLQRRASAQLADLQQDLTRLGPFLDYLLILHAAEGGFFRLDTGDMHVTVRPTYEVLSAAEDLSVPPVEVLGTLPPDAVITLSIQCNPKVLLDQSMVQEAERSVQHIRLQMAVGSADETRLHHETGHPEPVNHLLRISAVLQLSPETIEEHAAELMASNQLWGAEQALVAYTVILASPHVKLRVLVGTPVADELPSLDPVLSHLERNQISQYHI